MGKRGPVIFSALLSLTFLAGLLSVILLSQGVSPIGPVIGAPSLQPETVIPPVLDGPSGGEGPLEVPFPRLTQGEGGSDALVAAGGPGRVGVSIPFGSPPGPEDGADDDGGLGPPPGVIPREEDPPPGDDGPPDDDDHPKPKPKPGQDSGKTAGTAGTVDATGHSKDTAKKAKSKKPKKDKATKDEPKKTKKAKKSKKATKGSTGGTSSGSSRSTGTG